MEETLVIVNPHAGNLHAGRQWEQVAKLLKQAGIGFAASFTAARLDAVRIARQAIAEGKRNIIVFGGDGTMNEVVNGIFTQASVPPSEITLAMIPAGTGNDWCRMYGFPSDYEQIVNMIRRRFIFSQDVGVAVTADTDNPESHYFINIGGLGCDAEVVRNANKQKEKGRGGKLAYLISLLRTIFSFSGKEISIEADGKNIFTGRIFSANIGICRYSGGGMMQVPFAIADDGLFDITIIRDISKLTVVRNTLRLYDGSFVKLRQVSLHKASHIKIIPKEPLLLEADGEMSVSLPAEFMLLPRALNVIIPENYTVPSV